MSKAGWSIMCMQGNARGRPLAAFGAVGTLMRLGLTLAALLPAPILAQDARAYVSDELAVTLRAAKGTDATVLGLVHSGEAVTVLAQDTGSGYARVSTTDGRRGWLLSRYLSDQPSARQQMESVLADLEMARARILELEALSGVDVEALLEDNERLRRELEKSAADEQLRQRKSELARAQRNALLAGALVFVVGLALGAWATRRLAKPPAGWREL
jgi:SH3 domain protein